MREIAELTQTGSIGISMSVCTGNFAIVMNESQYKCTENWTCGKWSRCRHKYQTRICTDLNNCGTNETKPIISRKCR